MWVSGTSARTPRIPVRPTTTAAPRPSRPLASTRSHTRLVVRRLEATRGTDRMSDGAARRVRRRSTCWCSARLRTRSTA
eukprot:1044963-Rhodomonas_salina.1